jgi:hypothetical protein
MPAAFILDAALKSMAGGNLRAAEARFGRCRAMLKQQAESEGCSAELCCQLGDVCGAQVAFPAFFPHCTSSQVNAVHL